MLFSSKRTTTLPPPAPASALAIDSSINRRLADPVPPQQLATFEVLGSTAVATITVGELTGSTASRLVTDLLDEFAQATVRHYVFDLQNVTYMDSACIGVLVEMLTRIQAGGGRIALVNADRSVAYLFGLTRLDRLFPICRDVMTAISAVERAH